MFTWFDSLEADKSNLHWEQCTHNIEGWICNIKSVWIITTDQKSQNVQWNQVNYENVTTPCVNHVIIGDACHDWPEHASSFNGFHEEIENIHNCENCDTYCLKNEYLG